MSSIQVVIDGEGAFSGAAANIVNYSITEDGTSLNLANTQGGVGGIDFSVIEDDSFNGSILLPGQPFTLLDPRAGVQGGVIDAGTSVNDTGLDIRGASLLFPLVSERTVPAFSGTLSGAIQYYLALAGITEGIQIDPSFISLPVALPSFEGELWLHLKKLAAVHQFEIAAVGNSVIIRKPRLRTVDVHRYESSRLEYGNAQAARTVEVYYYNNEWKDDEQVYPNPDESIIEHQIISVGAGETTVTNVPVDMWIGAIDTPTQVTTLPWDMTSSTSVYSVVDRDGKAVSVFDWQNGGGSLSLETGADGKSVDVTVRGMAANNRAPYRIAASSQDREYQYAALYIAASGVAFERKMISTGTGAAEKSLPIDSVYTIDEPVVSTLDDAYSVMAAAALSLSGVSQRFEADTTHINRRGETGEIISPTFGEFDETVLGMTFGDFDAEWGTETFEDFDAYQVSLNAGDFESQAFGGIGGARVRHRDAMYRISGGRSAPGSFSWNADLDTTFEDWEGVYGDLGLSFGDFDIIWAGKTFENHARMPLYV